MGALREAMAKIDRAREEVEHADVRTQLESIGASLQEMLDTESGEQTDPDVAFGDAEFTGAAPHQDNLVELEESLTKLAETTENPEVREHLVTARRRIAAHRRDREGEERKE